MRSVLHECGPREVYSQPVLVRMQIAILANNSYKTYHLSGNTAPVSHGLIYTALKMEDRAQLECRAAFVPESMRQTGMRGAIYGARKEAHSRADREPASAD
jgi:hypothetical protein